MKTAEEYIKDNGFGDINDSNRPINIEIANVALLIRGYSNQQNAAQKERLKELEESLSNTCWRLELLLHSGRVNVNKIQTRIDLDNARELLTNKE